MVLSKFESLPPELIVETSDYLDGCDLYYALYGLNQRIDTILDQQCHRLHISFIHISKIKFDLYCNRILPHISTRIVSLTLCGGTSSTPGQIALFLSRFGFLATIFTKLESLKLIDFIKSDVEILIPHFPLLTHLKCLSIGEYTRLMPQTINTAELFNENVVLPNSLRSLAFPFEISNQWIETSFVQQLHVHSIHINLLPSFLQRFPDLKRLTTVLCDANENNFQVNNVLQPTIMVHALQYLNVNITQQVLFEHFAWFLKSVPQLHSLAVEAFNPDLTFFDAARWETVLLVNLSSFRFDLTLTLPANVNHLELLEPFKSNFWLSRSWFVEGRLRDQGRYLRLSTIRSPIITILHWPDDEILQNSTATAVYPNVTHIELWWNLSKSIQSVCPNVRSIHLYGAVSELDESIHPTVSDILQCPTLEHIIIDDNLPISQTRFATVLAKSSGSVAKLTCAAYWLCLMLESKQFEWICLLITIRIRKLLVVHDEDVLFDKNLIGFCRTFINLQEITMKLKSTQDLFFLLNTLEQLTMANLELPTVVLNDVIDITKWLQENTILVSFVIRKEIAELDTCKLVLWIGSRRPSNALTARNDLYLKQSIFNQYLPEN